MCNCRRDLTYVKHLNKSEYSQPADRLVEIIHWAQVSTSQKPE